MPRPSTTEFRLTQRARLPRILWPAFLMAGVLEMLTFAVVDPAELRLFGEAPLELSAQAVYTLVFLVYWFFMSLASLMTVLLMVAPDDFGESRRPHWP